MRTVWPHEFFRLDFDRLLDEGKRQEQLDSANAGECDLLRAMHAYLDREILPLILSDDRVYAAASRFARDYALECFHSLTLTGGEVYRTQTNLLELNKKVVDFLARAHRDGAAPSAGLISLSKASDFPRLVKAEGLSTEMRAEAVTLFEQTKDHEILQLKVTLRALRDTYEVVLPRVMYVVRTGIAVRAGIAPRAGDDRLVGISEYIDWYEARVTPGNALYPVLAELDCFYKVARNVGSHHRGLRWKPECDEVVLADRDTVLTVPVHEFQQKYRHLVYVCELGLRGILSAFCERDQGEVSNWLVKEYVKTFPPAFPEGEPGTLKFYPTSTVGTAGHCS